METLQSTPLCSVTTPPAFADGILTGWLEEVEQILEQSMRASRPCVATFITHLNHYRGKRLRPTLTLLAAQACGKVQPSHLILAAVVEMIHCATLVHDDVLDSASVRRHAPTVNAQWGNQISILLGDYLFTHAFHLASTVDAQACRLIGEATNRVCEGELQQSSQRGNLDLSEEEYLDIIEGKTAELTSCCCRLGALYSGVSAEAVQSMASFGRWLGMAFQVADDLLDLVGEEKRTGKSLGTDVEQQKLTLPIIHALTQSEPVISSRIKAILQSPGNHKLVALRPFLADSGALKYAQNRAEEFAGRAREELECLSPSPARSILVDLTRRVVHRSS